MNTLDIISLSDNDDIVSKEKTVKIMLSNLIEKYSLELIIDTIIEITTKPKNVNENDNNKNELYNIISLICNNTQGTKIFKYILDIQSEKNKEKKINKLIWNNNQMNKKNPYVEETFIDIDYDIDNNNNNNNESIITLDEEEDDDEEIIYISSDSDDDISIDNKMISLCENESTSYIDKKGRKTELKSKKRSKKKDKVSTSLNSYKMNSEKKLINIKIKLLRNKIKNLSYHCSMIYGHFFKYKKKSFNYKGIVKFICFNPKCEGYGTYNINNTIFTLLKEHIDINCSFNNLNSLDKKYYSYMKERNIDEMQIVRKK